MKTNIDYWPSFDTSLNNPYAKFGKFSGSQSTTGTIFKDFDYNGVGRNNLKGFKIHTELSGKFIVGHDITAPDSPTDGGYLQNNYGRVGNTGGANGVTLSLAEIPNHDHRGRMGTSPMEELDHSHKLINLVSKNTSTSFPTKTTGYSRLEYDDKDNYNGIFNYSTGYATMDTLLVGLPVRDTVNVAAGDPLAYGSLTKTSTFNYSNSIRGNYLPVRSRGENIQLTTDPTFKLGNTDWTNLKSHTHVIGTAGADSPHDNRPPYFVVLYYSKI